ncbi:hypothetical protein HNY73_015386 [Argiope bruennichi]|uniref:Uncharacterized protein n=1 Tax=Argiope bruennichi TaxID=94029 RepID=A0A8T0EWC9_ARGBR|nr:hypothetical protein HNY73_015386 [Argiope bruennichi]
MSIGTKESLKFSGNTNSLNWKEDFQVFKAWDLMKGRRASNDLIYFTDSKHRFATAMRKHSCVKFLKSSEKKYKFFQLTNFRFCENLCVTMTAWKIQLLI